MGMNPLSFLWRKAKLRTILRKEKRTEMPKCRNCGKDIKRYEDDICPHCGCANPVPKNYETMDVTKTIKKMAAENSDLYRSKSKRAYVLLCLLLGFFGAHNFYVGKAKLAIVDIIITLVLVGGLGSLLTFLTPLSFFGYLIGFGVSFLLFAFNALLLNGRDSLKDGSGEYLR